VIDGKGYKKGALEWLEKQMGKNLKDVFDMAKFQIWVNKGNI